MALREFCIRTLFRLLGGPVVCALWLPAFGAKRLSDTFNGCKALADPVLGLARHVIWPKQAFTAD